MKKLLSVINGNKTIICLGLYSIIEQAIKFDVLSPNKYINFAMAILLLLGGGSLTHHVKKGYFKQNKGN